MHNIVYSDVTEIVPKDMLAKITPVFLLRDNVMHVLADAQKTNPIVYKMKLVVRNVGLVFHVVMA